MEKIDEMLGWIDNALKTKNLLPAEQAKLRLYADHLENQKKIMILNQMVNRLMDQHLQKNPNTIFGERQRIGPGGPPIPGRINPMTNIREFLPNRTFGDRIKIHPGNIHRNIFNPDTGKI